MEKVYGSKGDWVGEIIESYRGLNRKEYRGVKGIGLKRLKGSKGDWIVKRGVTGIEMKR